MRVNVTPLVLAALLVAGLWPLAGLAPAQVTVPAGFAPTTKASGLNHPRGFVASTRLDFFCCAFVVEQGLNRVTQFGTDFPYAFATGLATPTDLVSPGQHGAGPFGNFLYVSEAGANRISVISNAGLVGTFATLPAAPQRMAFSPAVGAFGSFLFVTLANGQLVKVSPAAAVTSCASGLSGPQGLVFGPGGSAFKDTLFVAESSANRISKVDPTCTVTPFATTGLSNPVGLAISPGGAWGPLDTLYVVNAGTRVDQVDKTGTVTPFASGFTQADTVHFQMLGPIADRVGGSTPLYVSDATAGTITAAFVRGPFITPQLTGCNPCRAGDPFSVSVTFGNPSPMALPVEVKGGFQLPDGMTLNFSPLGTKHFETVMAAGLAPTTMPWISLPIPAIPTGRYCYLVGLGDPEVFGGSTISNRTCFDVVP